MNWNKWILILVFVFSLACQHHKESEEQRTVLAQSEASYFSTEHIIEAEELASNMDRSHIKIIDFRKKGSFNSGHLKNAINLWRPDIEDSEAETKGMMASRQQLESLLGNIGISLNDTLIVYDDIGGCDAARFWWVLQNHGFDSVRILNGGLEAWKAEGFETTYELRTYAQTVFSFAEDGSHDLLITHDKVLEALNEKDKFLIIDTRSMDEYSGKRWKSGAKQAGRIPGSTRVDWMQCINTESSHRFKSADELGKIYDKLNISKDHPIITYCHSGVRSAHTTFVLKELLGYTNVKNYDGSWTEWSALQNAPVEKDSITQLMN